MRRIPDPPAPLLANNSGMTRSLGLANPRLKAMTSSTSNRGTSALHHSNGCTFRGNLGAIRPVICSPSGSLRYAHKGNTRMPQNELEGSQGEGDDLLRRWCAARHSTDPDLTAARERQLARRIIDVPFVDQETFAAARMAIRMNWPVEALE